jgi:unsaturated chondroitin disaccharide hydrolase
MKPFRANSGMTGFGRTPVLPEATTWAKATSITEEFVAHCDGHDFEPFAGKALILEVIERAAQATAEFYISDTATDGIPYWDTGARRLHVLGDVYGRPADPGNDIEPVDSAAAVNAAQALLRLGAWRQAKGLDGTRYRQAGLTLTKTLLEDPYLSRDPPPGLDLAQSISSSKGMGLCTTRTPNPLWRVHYVGRLSHA